MEKKAFDLITFGEIMLRLSPPRHARIVDGDIFEKRAGGAELNVASGVAKKISSSRRRFCSEKFRSETLKKTSVQAPRGHFCFSPCFSAGRRHGILRATTQDLYIKENIDETVFMFALFKCRKSDKGRN